MGRSYKLLVLPALLAVGFILPGGCAAPATKDSTAPPSAPERPPPQRQSASDKRFIIAPELLAILHVVSVSLVNPPGAYLKIQVNVQNMTDAPQHFNYRIDWFDKDGGRLLLGADNFIPWMLLPHEVSSIAATAPAPMATDFGIAFIPTAR